VVVRSGVHVRRVSKEKSGLSCSFAKAFSLQLKWLCNAPLLHTIGGGTCWRI